MRLCALLLTLVLLVPARGQEIWDPARTWVFAVGVLRFKGKAKNDWPEEGRLDAVMLKTLRSRGVPDAQLVFIKNEQATGTVLRKRFAEFLRQPAPGDTLLFYYAGHGTRDYSDPQRHVSVLAFDDEWPAAEIISAIEQNFRGNRVWLSVECCYSGGFAEEAARHPGRISYGSLCSTQSSATSTGAWTFANCLINLFQGDPEADLNHDGVITFGEAGQYCDLSMAAHESQRAVCETTGSFPRGLVLARLPVRANQPPRIALEGYSDGKWYPARLLAGADGRYFVTWPGYDHSWDCWLPPEAVRPVGHQILPKQTAVQIKWGAKWYPGRVVRSALGLLLVHYDGYPAADDEWVPFERVRP